MTTRTLPYAEWSRLTDTALPDLLSNMAPADVAVTVVEDDGRIVGAWAVLRVTHLEGLWIAPEYRKKVRVAKALMTATLATARRFSPWAMTGADCPAIARLLTRHLKAAKVPMDTYVVNLEDSCPPLS